MKTKIAQIVAMLALLAIVATAFAHALDTSLQVQECENIQQAYLDGFFSALPDSEPISPKVSRMYDSMQALCKLPKR